MCSGANNEDVNMLVLDGEIYLHLSKTNIFTSSLFAPLHIQKYKQL